MAMVGFIFFAIGIGSLIWAFYILSAREKNVKFSKWLRLTCLITQGIFYISISVFCLNEIPSLVYLRAVVGLVAIFLAIFTLYVCRFSIKITEDGFNVRTLLLCRKYGYEDITSVSAVIASGISSFVLTVKKRKIYLNRAMQGYNSFLDKLEQEKVFLKCPII